MVEFRVLGPLEAVVDGEPIALPAAKPRALLALLLLNRNRVVSVSDLIDELWGDAPPETATKALQGYVSQLRKALGAERLLTKPPGYSLRVDEGELDLDRFEALIRGARERLGRGDAEGAARELREALDLWRGRPFAEFEAEPFARAATGQLEDARLAAVEDRIEAELVLGRHRELVPELEQLVAREPYRERPRGQLMLALYRAGRQADALELYRQTRETLVEELGIEPSRELQELEQAILRHDESLEPGRRPPLPPPGPAGEVAPRPSRRPLWLVAAALALAATTAIAAILIWGGGSSGSSAASGDRALRSFTAKLENFLIQSRDGRHQITSALARVSHCALGPRAAVVSSYQYGVYELLQAREVVFSWAAYQKLVNASGRHEGKK